MTTQASILDPADSQSARFKPASELASSRLRRSVDVWAGLRPGVFAPTRADVAAAKFREMLSSLVLLDVVDGGADFRFILGGQRTVELVGGRHAGQMLSSVSTTPFFARLERFYRRCVADRAPVAVGPLKLRQSEFGLFEAESVALPLSDDGQDVTGILSIMDIKPLRLVDLHTARA